MSARPAIRGPVFVAGPPGAGKTTLSKAVAGQLAVAWLDTDHEIARQTGTSPAEIVARFGASALRREERRVVEGLNASPRLVSLGGGAFIDPNTRAAIRRRGPVVALRAGRDTLWARLQRQASTEPRPLCADRSEFERLMDERDPLYARADLRASSEDSDGETSLLTTLHDLAFCTLRFPDRTTRIVIGRDLAQAAGAAAAECEPTRPVFLIEDAKVPARRRDAYASALDTSTGPVERYAVPGGEIVKSWAGLGDALEAALRAGCGRQSVVVGLGGGATCDFAAMVAGLLGRGAPLTLIPSTLLAQVDAAIGGKAAVNASGGKNLMGLFRPASDIIVDLELLESLDETTLGEGLAEAYKAALLSSESDRAALLDARSPSVITVARAIATKVRIVESDPWERGDRRRLNLGHTWGHAVEAAAQGAIAHGHAVAIGLGFIARWSADRGLLAPDVRDQILRDLADLGLPCTTPQTLVPSALERLRSDKKGSTRAVDLIALRGIGHTEIVQYSWSELEADVLRLEG